MCRRVARCKLHITTIARVRAYDTPSPHSSTVERTTEDGKVAMVVQFVMLSIIKCREGERVVERLLIPARNNVLARHLIAR